MQLNEHKLASNIKIVNSKRNISISISMRETEIDENRNAAGLSGQKGRVLRSAGHTNPSFSPRTRIAHYELVSGDRSTFICEGLVDGQREVILSFCQRKTYISSMLILVNNNY